MCLELKAAEVDCTLQDSGLQGLRKPDQEINLCVRTASDQPWLPETPLADWHKCHLRRKILGSIWSVPTLSNILIYEAQNI